MNEQLEKSIREQIGKAEKHDELLGFMQSFHWTAFQKQWEADNKPKDAKRMELAFRRQQRALADKKIRITFLFGNGTTKKIHEILDPLLSAIYVAGLKVDERAA